MNKNKDDLVMPIHHDLIKGMIGGLTKRELFSAMAMQGLLSDHEVNGSSENIAIVSVGMADALLEELNK